jgi:hypothetical protein
MGTKIKGVPRTAQVDAPVQVSEDHWRVFSAYSDEVYDVRRYAWGWDCSCADHSFRHMRQGGLCKHAGACWAQVLDEALDEEVLMAS